MFDQQFFVLYELFLLDLAALVLHFRSLLRTTVKDLRRSGCLEEKHEAIKAGPGFLHGGFLVMNLHVQVSA